MLARHMLLSGSKQGYESGGWLETLLSSPAVMLGGCGKHAVWGIRVEGASCFGEYSGSVEEWSPEHGFSQGPGCGVGLLSPGPANCQHHPSMDFAWGGAVWCQTALEWIMPVPPVTELGSVYIPKTGICSCCACGADRAGEGIVKMGRWGG